MERLKGCFTGGFYLIRNSVARRMHSQVRSANLQECEVLFWLWIVEGMKVIL